MPSPEEYTVGWICAVTPELVAAKAVLDEEYGDPDHIPVNDNNNYTLGRIGKHHVVVAVMAHWQYGIANAAVAARDMVHSFPNVRIGLMVGIGGGAPSKKHDIRLGDVVVTSPGYSNGGVFQYDYGVTVQNGTFETTGFLNQPPLFVLSAISALKADYETHGHDIEKTIDSILQKNIRLQRKYRRPDASTDVLYESAFEHVGDDDSSCTVMCNGDTSNIVPRVERTEYDDNPTIHYGLIASGSQLVKNALLRDKLAAEKEVLCFEMEAAGLMNHFPCLVVRGICDYSDTHKNATWQRYAAMAAAAYVKDLLNKIAPNKVEAERNLREVFYELGEKMDDIKLGIENIQGDNHFAKLHAWLSPPDPSTNYSRALEYRHSGTGKWFLESRQYSSWKRKRNSFLWLNGKSGCGKTILASTIIEELQELEQRSVRPRRSVHSRRGVQSRRGVYSPRLLYFYFDFIDTKKQSLEFALRSLAIQLYCKVEKARSPLDSLYSDHRDRSRPATQLLQKTLNNMIKQAGSLWIIIDALDECVTRRESHSGKLFPWIESLRKAEMNVHLLVTSRPEQDIASNIRNWARNTEIVLLQGIAINEDIRTYIGARLSEGEMQRWRSELEVEQYIKNTLEKKADGMFRWVACQLDALESCLDPVDVQNALGSLPETLGETYLRILNDVPARYEQKTTRILQFLTYSSRPLQIEELVDAIAVQPTSRPRFDQRNRMPIPEEITRYCSGLVTTTRVEKYGSDHYRYHLRRDSDTEITIIQLAHSSVKEFLISDSNRLKGFSGNAARAMITEVCLSYLLHLGQEKSSKSTYQRIEGYPLANYAAQEWTSHAAAIEASSDPKMGVVAEFFESEDTMRLCNNIYPSRRWLDRLMDPLMFAVYYGLIYSAERLIKNGADVNANRNLDGALVAAAKKGYESIAKELLEKDMCDPLYTAVKRSHQNIVSILISKGADINRKGWNGDSLLHVAVRSGDKEMARFLIDSGIDVNMTDRENATALSVAADRRDKILVKLLLEQGVAVNPIENIKAENQYPPLHMAALRDSANLVRLLINYGADVNAQATWRLETPLFMAVRNGNKNIFKLLVDNGANVNARNKYDETPLQVAASRSRTG
ncbi:hypothetical protein F5Y04DRAFT_268633 [Hypomontagnella monticulosa]|nr:hypothetical protein F5Y04DRAFT_268633 [Hypomontagnella monticulosa]